MKTRTWKWLLGSMLSLAGCAEVPSTADSSAAEINAPPPADVCSVDSPRAVPLQMFVFPEVGTAPYANEIATATRTIDVMVYQMGFGPVLSGLEAKARAGIKVRVILDLAQKRVNERYMNRLRDAGAEVIWSDPKFTYTHAKMIIIDGAKALIGTGNYSESYMIKERNLLVLDKDPDDVAAAQRIFDADFVTHTDPDLSCTRLVVAPVNARQRILDLINSATQTLLVHSMQLGDKDVRNALAARKAAGVDVRVIVADPNWIEANAFAMTFLAEHAIPARWREHLHVKSIVVDGRAAYVGSVNLSWNSMNNNREVGLVVTEPVNVAAEMATWEADWAIGTEFVAAPVPPAPTGAPTPSAEEPVEN